MRKSLFLLLASLMILAVLAPGNHVAAKSLSRMQPQITSGSIISHNGPIMRDTSYVYAIFWEPSHKVSSRYHTLIEQYFNDVGNSSLYHNNTQYGEPSGYVPHDSKLGGIWIDTTAYPKMSSGATKTMLTKADIQEEVERARSTNHWITNNHNLFFVFTESGEDFSTTDCAGHSYYAPPNNADLAIFSIVPYIASISRCSSAFSSHPRPNNDDADMSIFAASHEQMEMVTDPYDNGWFADRTATSSKLEIADKCQLDSAGQFGTLNSDGSNVAWNGHHYVIARVWSNLLSRCTLGNDILYSLIINYNSGKVMGVGAASTANGATIVQWPDTVFAPAAEHLWGFIDVGGGNVMIVNYNSGKVLGVAPTRNSQLLQCPRVAQRDKTK